MMISISGNNNIGDTIMALRAWALSTQWILDVDEWKECFGEGRNNKELALKYSRKHFKKMFPEYFKNARYHGRFSEEKKKEAFNIFYNETLEDLLIEEVEEAEIGV